ncbi:MAG: nucleotidyl transferase AbiEii/AbiGii toxin family protein [Acidimicrobiales bacterium]
MAKRLSRVGLIRAVHDRLAGAGIDHAFGGAIALAYYVAEPRSTRNLDINLAVPADRADQVFARLPDGAGYTQADVAQARAGGQTRLWYGRPRDGVPIDLYFPRHRFHGVVGRAAVTRTFAAEGYTIPVIAADHLAVFKILYGRPRDWVDIADMLGAGSLDPDAVLAWVCRLLGEDHPSYARFVDLTAAPARQIGQARGLKFSK